MKRISQSASTASTELAKALLRAWLDGEPSELDRQLERSCHSTSCGAAIADAGEEERLELLESVASRIRTCSQVSEAEPTDPALVVCMDLLLHLAQKSTPIPVSDRLYVARNRRTPAPSAPRTEVFRIEIALTPSN